MGRRFMILTVISLLLIALDQLAKMYIISHFQLGESITVIPEVFNITYVRNMGAAFGILNDSHETFRHLFFMSIPPLAVAIIVYFIYGLPDDDHVQVVALSSIAGGALGNYIDRIRFGYVIDFLDFHLINWPVFNIADSAIVIGVGVLSLILVKEWKEERAAANSDLRKSAQ